MGVAQGHVQVAVRISLVTERATRQPQHSAGMPGREWDLEAIRRRVRQPVHAIRPEIVILLLLAVGDHRRACGLESLDGVSDCLLIERIQCRVRAVSCRERLDQPKRPRNTPDWLGWDRHWCKPPLCQKASSCLAGRQE